MSEPVAVLSSRYDVEDAHTLEGYKRTGGYTALPQALETDPAELRQTVKDAGLRGRGGAGFPTGVKWGFMPVDQTDKSVYLVVNADESEPGTFKDRELMERDPHQLLEGIAISCHALKSERAFIYIRGEYLFPGMRLEEAIAEAYRHNYLGDDILGSGVNVHVTVHYGAGAYICGEETALLDSLEGRRGQPRLRPPFPAAAGLYASPTAVNNVETIANVPWIVERGVDWFKSLGTEKAPGTKLVCVSGEVNRPGNYEWPMGATLREILEVSCEGMLEGRELKFWAPGGSSTPLLTADHQDVGLDFESIAEAGSLLGTAAVVVCSHKTSAIQAAYNWTKFYEHESCGKCTPCREGAFWLSQVYERMLAGGGRWQDLRILDEVCDNIFGRAFCALGDAIASPIQSSLQYFRDEYEHLIEHGRLPDGLEPHAGVIADNAQSSRPTAYAVPRDPTPAG
ncbi:NADH oxidoreductase (quinone) subunit F [Egibacter rhizosphaerae]|uniref:NADH-quinone oxidoreductase subunit F n=1 Tax=Egibacter rhizosphaerae TaxID=1670831 RepID=A0A411YH08_9ACTN|nr:NADH-quinone oxidoreductase subunit NuoF [Egibacter rhizosphaerae]QBI20362.1 NADH oxidoreductase (quinone) subunit F [Egibacter rhizosphaerae]